MPGFNLSINTITPAVYLTTLTDAEIQELKTRLYNFNVDADRAAQYAEVEEIMNRLKGTLVAESDQMELASLFSVMEKVKEGKPRVSKPSEFVSVLLKIVEHVKGQTGGMNRFPPRGYSVSKRTLVQPVQQLHATMSPAEAAQRQQVFKRDLVAKTRKIKATNKANSNENYGNVYPVTNTFKIPVGNTNNSTRTRASSAANTYNLFDRPRHKAAWNAVFSNTNTKKVKKAPRGGVRNQSFPKSNTPVFRKAFLASLQKSTLSNNQKKEMYKRYEDMANAKLATGPEIYALLSLSNMKRPETFSNLNKL